ncbi:MAG: DNA replication/repair protein RecF [Ruminococcaceae bacterium]|nr:DNA replication/repair protein RecF [Oscillospiraceae bacterium]
MELYIKRLRLKNFRNYKEQTIYFSPKTNILCGDNAQGKTNVLEAIYMFAFGKSFRTQQERETIFLGQHYTKIDILYDDSRRENSIEIIILKDRKKQIKINGVNITKLSELLSKLSVVLFFPDELGLIKEGPFVRRRFLDVALSGARPRYYHLLGKYNKILDQRNNLIKKMRSLGENPIGDTLSVWNESLASYGIELCRYRTDYVNKLCAVAKKIHLEATGEDLLVSYKTKFKTKEEMLEKIESSFTRELEQGCSLYGPHRDDIDIIINGKDAKSFASQGQQRSAILSLKLAQAEILYEETGEYPILLLDDILSELDFKRRSFLVKKIPDKQVIITCAGIDEVFEGSNANIINVKDGHII